MAHKRIDVAVRAFDRLRLPLLVIGDGPEARRLAGIAGPTCRSPAGSATRASRSCSRRARALVVTATEEFGIAAVESLAAGRPVIALDEGGVRESVSEGRPARSSSAPIPARWRRRCALRRARRRSAACRASAERFSAERFRARLAGIVDEAVRDERAPRPGERPPNRGLAGVPRRRTARGARTRFLKVASP